MTTTETIDAILAACRKCVELGEKAPNRPWFIDSDGVWDKEGVSVIADHSDGANAFIAHACNIGVAACLTTERAILDAREVASESSDPWACGKAQSFLDFTAQTWRSAV